MVPELTLKTLEELARPRREKGMAIWGRNTMCKEGTEAMDAYSMLGTPRSWARQEHRMRVGVWGESHFPSLGGFCKSYSRLTRLKSHRKLVY